MEIAMPGEHSDRERRQAEHVKADYMRKGMSEEEAERLAWKTVNSQRKTSIRNLRGK
jgi:hypothetical protein